MILSILILAQTRGWSLPQDDIWKGPDGREVGYCFRAKGEWFVFSYSRSSVPDAAVAMRLYRFLKSHLESK